MDGAARSRGAVLDRFGAEACTSQVPALSLLWNALVMAEVGMPARDEPQLEGTVLGRGSHPQATLRACTGQALSHQINPSDAGTRLWVAFLPPALPHSSQSDHGGVFLYKSTALLQ